MQNKRPLSFEEREKLTAIMVAAFMMLFLAIILIVGTVNRTKNAEATATAVVASVSSPKTSLPEKLSTTITEATTTALPVAIPDNVKAAFVNAGADATYTTSHPYCIAVNTYLNEVIVYSRSADGTFSDPYKAMVASCGRLDSPTITGTFKTVEKYVWRALNGGVYGQYATRIEGPYLFHSVPYYQQDPGTLETEEYNHLGENRSQGCVRLAVSDCKWIYDNCPVGTIVTIYNSNSVTEPLPKPSPQSIPISGELAGWDPTDPNSNNPWHQRG